MKIARAAPVLFVDHVESTRDFFKRAGFELVFEVPAGSAVGFAMLERDGVQVMVETRGNENESAALRALTLESRRAVVFVEVDDLDALVALLGRTEIIVERHATFYKSDEITYQEPGGNIVTFAQFQR
jgi:threonine dehydrogenase-like Zn-dependent dehydrogenase